MGVPANAAILGHREIRVSHCVGFGIGLLAPFAVRSRFGSDDPTDLADHVSGSSSTSTDPKLASSRNRLTIRVVQRTDGASQIFNLSENVRANLKPP